EAHQEVLMGSPGEQCLLRHDAFGRSSSMPGVLHRLRTVASRPGVSYGLGACRQLDQYIMKNKIVAILLAALTLLFAFLALWSALAFLLAENWIANVLGVAVVAIVVFGIWSLIRELRFGANTEKLARILETEGKLPEDTL